MTEPCACFATRPVSTDSSRSPSFIFSLNNFLAVIFSTLLRAPPAWLGGPRVGRGVSSAARRPEIVSSCACRRGARYVRRVPASGRVKRKGDAAPTVKPTPPFALCATGRRLRPRARACAVTFGNPHEPVTGRGLLFKRRKSSFTYADNELARPTHGGTPPTPYRRSPSLLMSS